MDDIDNIENIKEQSSRTADWLERPPPGVCRITPSRNQDEVSPKQKDKLLGYFRIVTQYI